MDKLQTILKKITIRRSFVATAVVVLLVALSFALWRELAMAPESLPDEVSRQEVVGMTLSESEPTHIRIPEISVDATFEAPLGLKENNEIEVPDGYEEVAYYKYGPTPGELGPSVILGHVDSYQGAAVFYLLGQLEEGDEIEIDREDGTTAIFAVTRLERHEQSGFPTVEVYQDIDHAGLRLITCSGTYNHGTLRYSHNLIVFAKLVGVIES